MKFLIIFFDIFGIYNILIFHNLYINNFIFLIFNDYFTIDFLIKKLILKFIMKLIIKSLKKLSSKI
jgi:hypothetical protein